MPEVISDSHFLAHASRSRGKVVLITNAAAAGGVGGEVARAFARFGAKIVIGDRNEASVTRLVDEIGKTGAQCVGRKCDSASWEDLFALYELGTASYERVDYIVVNSGIALEGNQSGFAAASSANTNTAAGGPIGLGKADVDDGPPKPNLDALDANLIGVLYAVRLAFFELDREPTRRDTAIVIVGPVGNEPVDAASKHGILGLARALRPRLEIKRSRIVVVAPDFKDASLLGVSLGTPAAQESPHTTIERIAGAVVLGATHPSTTTNGSIYGIADGYQVFRIASEELTLCDDGLFKILFGRLRFLFTLEEGIRRFFLDPNLWTMQLAVYFGLVALFIWATGTYKVFIA
ncbi:hypothetical protein BOTBODRAFT_190686 [Botryobasidium botryosum FD-172 SS1]|uniref:Ketoreductase (KR) domain-containing protein n=1 Tax=Botryobasidium botryosum (strain FD-172 SS1) TaxID=930990 RepID=A0A067M5S1_BOTB1|nr:hypothetical protein BOTBODRAFT_190686 [Botryobasidium botryosum FD-172 SS1]